VRITCPECGATVYDSTELDDEDEFDADLDELGEDD
jgi:hypothetical protein